MWGRGAGYVVVAGVRRLRWVHGAALALLAAATLATTDGTAAAANSTTVVVDTSHPSAGHPYRHGALPLRRSTTVQAATAASQPATARAGRAREARAGSAGGRVRFGGGVVLTGSPAVYLVFWGSQWGTQSTGADGYLHYSGDPDGLAPNLQALFSGLGTNGELWSTIVTQYCQGVAAGAVACPPLPLDQHVGYPSATVLRGVWEDTSTGYLAATSTQIADEAARAAVHFGDPTNAQYVVVSPTGTDPDQWLNPRYGYCAYHDNTGDPGLGTVPGPDVPYTNMPYVPDVGPACSSFADPGVLDGADETVSHEYAEVLTDPYPISGWTDHRGDEVADKCENLAGGAPGGSRYVALATGTFALQGVWGVDAGKRGGCENTHSPVLAVAPARQRTVQDQLASLQLQAADVLGRALHYSATGLPTGLAIDPSSGLVYGVPLRRGRWVPTVSVSDASFSTAFSFVWKVRR